MTAPKIDVEVDKTADAAYVSVGARTVARTVAFDDMTMIDLDEHDVVVGIELLSLAREWPMADVVQRYHVPSEAIALIARITNPMLLAPQASTESGASWISASSSVLAVA